MSKKVFNMQGGKHSAAAYTELEKWAYGSCVASLTSFVVSAGTGMNVNISTGAGLISDTIARRIGTDATETATVPTASASFNRLDSVVAYIDTSVTPSIGVTDNTNNILKFVVVAGTAASTPVAPTGAAIISAIGAGKPYMVLYDVLVPQNATNTASMTFTDRRVLPTAQALPDNIVTTAKINALAVTTAKIAANAITAAKIETQQAWVAVTYQNSWVAHVAPYTGVYYMKDSLGFVHFKGLTRNGTVGATIFTLPAGYRPAERRFVVALINGQSGALEINSDGTVNGAVVASNSYVSFDNVTFKAEA